jgi:hypothetical protein
LRAHRGAQLGLNKRACRDPVFFDIRIEPALLISKEECRGQADEKQNNRIEEPHGTPVSLWPGANADGHAQAGI